MFVLLDVCNENNSYLTNSKDLFEICSHLKWLVDLRQANTRSYDHPAKSPSQGRASVQQGGDQ
ncbi:MAG TPA: hypothetical protein VGC62_14675 [Pseudomonas sp.]